MLLAERYIFDGKYKGNFLITAEIQSDGRGRKKNDWVSNKGGLWFNIVLDHVTKQDAFTLFIGLCIIESLINITQCISFKIKWPNDIYLFDYKVGGIICSQYKRFNKTSIGIGINTNNEKPNVTNANSIKTLTAITINNEVYQNHIVDCLFENLNKYEKNGFTEFIDKYLKYDYLTGKDLTITTGEQNLVGAYKGVNTQGELVLENKEGIHNIISGTIDVKNSAKRRVGVWHNEN